MKDEELIEARKQILAEMKIMHDILVDLETTSQDKMKIQAELRKLTEAMSKIKLEHDDSKKV